MTKLPHLLLSLTMGAGLAATTGLSGPAGASAPSTTTRGGAGQDTADEGEAELAATLDAAHAVLTRLRRTGSGASDPVQVAAEKRTLVAEAIHGILFAPGAKDSGRACTMLVELATEAYVVRELTAARDAWEFIVDYRERHFEQAADQQLLPQARHMLAIIQYQLGQRNWGRAAMEDVVRYYKEHPPREVKEDLKAQNDLALMLRQMDELVRARLIQEQVLIETEALDPPDPRLSSLANRNLAETLMDMGDLPRARQLLEKGFGSAPTRQNRTERSRLFGKLSLFQGDREQALVHYQDCARDHAAVPAFDPDRASVELSLARTLSELGRTSEARTRATSTFEALQGRYPDDHALILYARRILAYCSMQAGEYDAAEESLRARLLSFESRRAGWHPDALHSRCNLISLLRHTEDWDAFEDELERLYRDLQAWVSRCLTLSPREARERVHLCDAYLSVLLSFQVFDLDDELGALEAFDLAETFRAIATDGLRPARSQADEEELADLRGAIRNQRQKLSDLIAGVDLAHDGERPSGETVQRAVDDLDRLERELHTELTRKLVVAPTIDSLALAESLDDRTAAVGIRRIPLFEPGMFVEDRRPSHDRFVAFVIRQDPDETLRVVSLGDAVTVDGWIQEWRHSINRTVNRGVSSPQDFSDNRADEIGVRIREQILDPVLAAAEEVDRLHVCLDSTLHLLPLDALPLGDARVGDQVRIIHQLSFAPFMQAEDRVFGAPSLLVLGDPNYYAGMLPGADQEEDPPEPNAVLRAITGGRQFGALAGTRSEARQVSELFDLRFGAEHRDLLLGDAATKGSLLGLAPGRRYLHLATHGFMTRSATLSTLDTLSRSGARQDLTGLGTAIRGLAPMSLCGIALAGANRGADAVGQVGGILSATELASLNLHDCELAVLSACETNVGIHRSGLGIQSLQAALHAGGVQTTITSLWEVPDEQTREMMNTFYSNLWMRGADKADALWAAKMALRARGESLVHWSGWTLAGGRN